MMDLALHLQTQVLPGHKIEIQSDNLEIGDTVDVFVVIPTMKEKQEKSILTLIEKIRENRQCFKSVEEVDKYLEKERESWNV